MLEMVTHPQSECSISYGITGKKKKKTRPILCHLVNSPLKMDAQKTKAAYQEQVCEVFHQENIIRESGKGLTRAMHQQIVW